MAQGFWEEDKVKYYKGKYTIAFYSYDTDELLYMFDNIKDIIEFQGRDTDTQTIVLTSVNLYRSLKRPDNKCRFLDGSKMRVYLIDNDD